MPMQGGFNANQFEPNQGMSAHPPAQKIPFRITGTAIKENSSKDGGYFEVELTSSMGSVIMRYNIWNKTPKAVEIAHGQLSALCRATGIYQLDWGNDGAALRGAQGLMDVGYQKGEEPSPDNPNAKGYTELKRVYDMAGNDPSKPGQAQQAQPQQNTQQQPPQGGNQQPMQQQPGGGWSQPNQQQPQQSQPQQNGSQGGWNGQGGAVQQQPQQNAGGAWQPGQNGGNAGGSPPWGSRT